MYDMVDKESCQSDIVRYQISKYCQAQPKSQLSCIMAIPNHPPPATTHRGLNEAIYRPDFDQTLNVGFLDQPQQIPTVMVIFVQATFVLIRSISAVTVLMLTKLSK